MKLKGIPLYSKDDYIAKLEAMLRLAMPIVEEVAAMFEEARFDGDITIMSKVGSKFDKRVMAAVDSDGWMELSTSLDI